MCGCGCELALAVAQAAMRKTAPQGDRAPSDPILAVEERPRSKLAETATGAWFAAVWRRYLATTCAARDVLHARVTQSMP